MSDADAPICEDAITALDDRTIERIAAGEVVERPASAVKELVENSLDAGASRIEVDVVETGLDSIRVSDDGVGMTQAAVRKAVRQHTTSKLRDIGDLEAGVGTLGFRGEALHTIAAVSRLTITTRPSDGESGTELQIDGGDVTSVRPAGRPTGTTVEVRDLFYNTPARREFLRAPATEFDHITRVVTNYALANPDVAVSLRHDDRDVFSTPGQGDLRGTILAVYGSDVAEAMIDLEKAPATDGPVRSIEGVVSHPETNRSRARYLSTFVNGRYVTSRTLREAVVDAYGKQLAANRYPFAVLFCEIPADAVDVNVHPRKTEVRFEAEHGVAQQVTDTVQTALLDAGLIRSSAPRGRSAAPETVVTPESRSRDTAASTGEPAGSSSSESESTTSAQSRTRSTPPTTPSETTTQDASEAAPSGNTSTTSPQPDTTQRNDDSDERRFRGGTTQETITGEDPDVTFDRLPSLEIIGQYADTYIIAESADGLVLIDQHAADERINFERLRRAFAEDNTSQKLVRPVELELTADEAAAFPTINDALRELGFDAEQVGRRTIAVRGVPAILQTTVDPEDIRDALGEAIHAADPAGPVEEVADAILGDMACYPSITGKTRLAEGSIIELLDELDGCRNPYACPHGRPVIVELSESELADRFERDYPGHAERRR